MRFAMQDAVDMLVIAADRVYKHAFAENERSDRYYGQDDHNDLTDTLNCKNQDQEERQDKGDPDGQSSFFELARNALKIRFRIQHTLFPVSRQSSGQFKPIRSL